MASGLVVVDIPRTAPKPRLPLRRLSENFFQRWLLILLPIVLMALIGVLLAQRVQPEFSADATVNASINPLVDPIIEPGRASFGESVAEASARVINERLSTDLFVGNMAERVGLAEALENDLLRFEDIRESVQVRAAGDSLVNVTVTWADPETAILLVDATIDEHLDVLRTTVSANAQTAVDFFESRLNDAIATEQVASADLNQYVDTLPELEVGEETPVADALALRRLNDRLTTAQAEIDSTLANIEDARLSVIQAESDAGRSLTRVDQASSTFEPESTLAQQGIIVFAFLAIGGLIALTTLLLSTHLDRSVRSAGDIEAAGGGLTVAAVPVIKSLRTPKVYQRALGSRRAS